MEDGTMLEHNCRQNVVATFGQYRARVTPFRDASRGDPNTSNILRIEGKSSQEVPKGGGFANI
jgi:hypothetical protein